MADPNKQTRRDVLRRGLYAAGVLSIGSSLLAACSQPAAAPTAAPAAPSTRSSSVVMQRQWAATRRSERKPVRARYSVGNTPRCSRTAATSPQIWFRWMVATTSSLD